jgi:hypothetical protein
LCADSPKLSHWHKQFIFQSAHLWFPIPKVPRPELQADCPPFCSSPQQQNQQQPQQNPGDRSLFYPANSRYSAISLRAEDDHSVVTESSAPSAPVLPTVPAPSAPPPLAVVLLFLLRIVNKRRFLLLHLIALLLALKAFFFF